MKPRAFLFSVPHTGTTFTEMFLRSAGMLPHRNWRQGYVRLHTRRNDLEHPHAKRVEQYYEETPIIVPLRDPLLCLKSHLQRGSGTVDDVRESFDILIDEVIPRAPKCFYFNLECGEELRESHLFDCANFFDLDVELRQLAIKQYAKDWRPRNTQPTYKDVSIAQEDIDKLSDAIIWHQQCLNTFNNSYLLDT